ncbi:MAG: folylpolyglutamate synthase/dihydrofolate synthase family protein [Hyphomicrobiales bacterium]
MNYKETLDYLFSQLPMYQRVGKSAYKSDLFTTVELLNYLGNPENEINGVHIAGTNGKGSVAHLTASILQETGLKVGLYTSPHLKDFRERVKINGEPIPEKDVIKFVGNNKEGFSSIAPSFFEMTVGLAFCYFKQEKTDINVIEVGMGGRLDSTNLMNSQLSVITNIGLDHTQFLGDTLEKIAKEKAGIIKEKTPAVIGQTQEETKDVFISNAKDNHSEITFADQELKMVNCNYTTLNNNPIIKADILYKDKVWLKDIISPLSGSYQKKNILTCLMSVIKLKEQGFHISDKHITDGIYNVITNTGIKGRWQQLSENPRVICDTGHNFDGVQEILHRLELEPYKKLHFVLGVVNDKDIESILSMLPKNAIYYYCKANIPRGLDADTLNTKASIVGLKGKIYDSVEHALNTAKTNAKEGDLVFVGGSTFTVAEVV